MKIFYYLSVFIFFPCCIAAQDSIVDTKAQEIIYDLKQERETLPFDLKKIEEYQKQEEFNYTEKEEVENAWTRFKKWLNQIFRRFIRWLSGGEITGFWNFVFQVLPYLVIVAVLFLLGWLFLKVNPSDMLFEKQEPPQVVLTDEEDIIQNQDIQDLINKALQNNNYRLAIRYYYLMVLKKLSDLELIQWEAQKTNTDYSKELNDATLKKQFGVITKLYDYIWYGSFEVNEKDYQTAEKEFKHISNQIKS